MRNVLDSWAVMAWIEGEQPARRSVDRLVAAAERGEVELMMSLINVGEVYYVLAKRRGVEEAEAFLSDLAALPIRTLVPNDALILDAARLKGRFAISYVDAFAVETARQQAAPLVTGDPELKLLAHKRIVELDWVGR
jgi:predicted nucleic acid-binding protein